MEWLAGLVDRQRHDIELDVWPAGPRMSRHGCTAYLACPNGQGPAAAQHPIQALRRQLQWTTHVVVQ
jgi:hypothetical protein